MKQLISVLALIPALAWAQATPVGLWKTIDDKTKTERALVRVVESNGVFSAKLEKLLKRYAPDLVQLHGVIENRLRKQEYVFTVNLSLPTGTLHATGEAANVRASVKMAFEEIEAQVKKHQALLRKDYEWKRKRPRAKALAS